MRTHFHDIITFPGFDGSASALGLIRFVTFDHTGEKVYIKDDGSIGIKGSLPDWLKAMAKEAKDEILQTLRAERITDMRFCDSSVGGLVDRILSFMTILDMEDPEVEKAFVEVANIGFAAEIDLDKPGLTPRADWVDWVKSTGAVKKIIEAYDRARANGRYLRGFELEEAAHRILGEKPLESPKPDLSGLFDDDPKPVSTMVPDLSGLF